MGLYITLHYSHQKSLFCCIPPLLCKDNKNWCTWNGSQCVSKARTTFYVYHIFIKTPNKLMCIYQHVNLMHSPAWLCKLLNLTINVLTTRNHPLPSCVCVCVWLCVSMCVHVWVWRNHMNKHFTVQVDLWKWQFLPHCIALLQQHNIWLFGLLIVLSRIYACYSASANRSITKSHSDEMGLSLIKSSWPAAHIPTDLFAQYMLHYALCWLWDYFKINYTIDLPTEGSVDAKDSRHCL